MTAPKPDFVIPAVNQNTGAARTAGPDDVSGNAPPTQNIDDPERSRLVIDQGQQQEVELVASDKPYVPMTPEQRAKRKAMLVQAFDRGIVHDRLFVKLPPHLHGEWARNDPLEIDRLKTLGFEIDETYAQRRGIHSDGTGAAIVGDVIFMTCPKEVKELIDEVRLEKFIAINGKPGDKRAKSKEEREFETNSARDSQGVVPTLVESRTETRFSKADVEAALEKVDQQTRVQTPPAT
jgi:hypothetical protein